jgi:hypothetical protein
VPTRRDPCGHPLTGWPSLPLRRSGSLQAGVTNSMWRWPRNAACLAAVVHEQLLRLAGPTGPVVRGTVPGDEEDSAAARVRFVVDGDGAAGLRGIAHTTWSGSDRCLIGHRVCPHVNGPSVAGDDSRSKRWCPERVIMLRRVERGRPGISAGCPPCPASPCFRSDGARVRGRTYVRGAGRRRNLGGRRERLLQVPPGGRRDADSGRCSTPSGHGRRTGPRLYGGWASSRVRRQMAVGATGR